MTKLQQHNFGNSFAFVTLAVTATSILSSIGRMEVHSVIPGPGITVETNITQLPQRLLATTGSLGGWRLVTNYTMELTGEPALFDYGLVTNLAAYAATNSVTNDPSSYRWKPCHQWVQGPFWVRASGRWDRINYSAPSLLVPVEHCTECGALRLPEDYRKETGKHL